MEIDEGAGGSSEQARAVTPEAPSTGDGSSDHSPPHKKPRKASDVFGHAGSSRAPTAEEVLATKAAEDAENRRKAAAAAAPFPSSRTSARTYNAERTVLSSIGTRQPSKSPTRR